jgi:hypothetical protein
VELENPELGRWVHKQQTEYKANCFVATHNLNVIFVWDLHEAQWLERFDELINSVEENDITLFPIVTKRIHDCTIGLIPRGSIIMH